MFIREVSSWCKWVWGHSCGDGTFWWTLICNVYLHPHPASPLWLWVETLRLINDTSQKTSPAAIFAAVDMDFDFVYLTFIGLLGYEKNNYFTLRILGDKEAECLQCIETKKKKRSVFRSYYLSHICRYIKPISLSWKTRYVYVFTVI